MARRTILSLFGLLLLAACGGSQPADATAPTVVSVYPADGFHGFKRGEAITITFNEPVDPISVMEAYRSDDEGLKPDQVTFAFADGGKKVYIQPVQPLLYSPTDAYLYYAFELGPEVSDRSGNPLAQPLRVSFSTMRTLTANLPSERAFDGSASPTAAVSDQALLSVGDGATDAGIRGFFSFAFPEDAGGVLAAELRFFVHHISGTPFADLGRLSLEPVTLGDALDATDYYVSALATPITDAGTGWTDGSYRTYGVSDWAIAAWNEGRGRLEVRLRFDAETDHDGSTDALFLVAQDAEEVPEAIGPEYLPVLRLTYYGP
ncbi:Ig-like domain-containing protein [Oceanithermus desulfurans]|uniref:Methionine-rich copper-binding protein CopC n=1 Tax=Oceanithermus desulfurans TaxID=227924 RepID=A0ABR6P449_9DEIN|nr:Ig-like domain-containing protein [Oceanithermus desulfurans]MBB6030856.1 methionine-rich copper-binding protein CopC [Oceanithermus desulfurans]